MRDPKLGYHWVWLYPLAVLLLVVLVLAFPFIKFIDFYQKYRHYKNIQRIYKKNPDIKDLSILAGTKK